MERERERVAEIMNRNMHTSIHSHFPFAAVSHVCRLTSAFCRLPFAVQRNEVTHDSFQREFASQAFR